MYFMYIGVLLACVFVPCVPGAMETRRGHQDSWDMELQMVELPCSRCSEFELGLSVRAVCIVNL